MRAVTLSFIRTRTHWSSALLLTALLAGCAESDDAQMAHPGEDTYNRYCSQGKDPEFNRRPATLVPLDKRPFYACWLWPGGSHTQGGPRRNARSQIVNTDGDPIPGLYGGGELGSVFGMLYPSGGGNLAECIAFGRIAGENAAREKPRRLGSA